MRDQQHRGITGMARARKNCLFGGEFASHVEHGFASQLRGAVKAYTTSIVPLPTESYGMNNVQCAWREFTLDRSTPFTGHEIHCEFFFSWLLHAWAPARNRGSQLADPSLYGKPPTR